MQRNHIRCNALFCVNSSRPKASDGAAIGLPGSCASAASYGDGGFERRLHLVQLVHERRFRVHVPLAPSPSCACPITPANRHVPLAPSPSCACPMTVERTPETKCFPQWSCRGLSTPVPACPRPNGNSFTKPIFLYTGKTPPSPSRIFRPVRGVSARHTGSITIPAVSSHRSRPPSNTRPPTAPLTPHIR